MPDTEPEASPNTQPEGRGGGLIADENVLIEVGIVDVTEHLNDKLLSEWGAKRYDYRLVAATPTGGVVSFPRGATANDVVAYWQREGWLQ
jgi:hypothetical protein